MITQTCLKSLISYNPLTGTFTWKARPIESFATIGVGKMWNARFAGRVAGSVSKITGYLRIGINGKYYLAHRLAWLYINGSMPKDEIDHLSHDRADNRMSNLREATHTQNGRNQSMYNTNTSGFTGVSWHKRSSKWVAHIMANDKIKHLGYFSGIKDAIAAREQANIKYNFHKNHGAI